ncbi:MAG: recombinase family protein [Chloroflexota bacterium]|nr:recombinase family protein [Chloroflexota bacterium]
MTEDFEDSAVGKFIRSAKAFAAEVEREKFRERSMRGKLARVLAGKLMHGKTPLYGYAWTDDSKGRLTIDPVTVGVVRRIFTEAANGRPLRSIARALDEDRIPTPRGAKVWDFVAIGRLLHNPAYVGEAYAFRQRYERVPGASRSRRIHLPPEEWTRLPDGTIPPIVSREIFEAVQARLALNKVRSPRRTIDREAYLLRGGFVRCGYCGYTMVVHHKLRTVAYTCTKRSRSTGTCTHHGISTRILDASVWARVESVLTQPEVIAAELERLRSSDPTEGDLNAVDRGLVEIKRKLGNLSQALAMFNDAEAAAPVVAEIENLRGQQRRLEAEREAVVVRRAGWEEGQRRLADLQAWCRHVSTRLSELTYDQKRLALEALGVQVRVWRTDHEPRYEITAQFHLDDLPAPDLAIAPGYMLRPRTPARSGCW